MFKNIANLFLEGQAGFDYNAISSTTTFPSESGLEYPACLQVTIIDDDVVEPSQQFTVLFTMLDPHVVTSTSRASVTILDNDC